MFEFYDSAGFGWGDSPLFTFNSYLPVVEPTFPPMKAPITAIRNEVRAASNRAETITTANID